MMPSLADAPSGNEVLSGGPVDDEMLDPERNGKEGAIYLPSALLRPLNGRYFIGNLAAR